MDVAHKHKRPTDWGDEAVIAEMGLNLESLFDITDRTVESMSVIADIPTDTLQVYYSGGIKNVNSDYLEAISSVFGVDNIELLASKFLSETERESFWRDHLQEVGLLKSGKRVLPSSSVESTDKKTDTNEVDLADTTEVSKEVETLALADPEWQDEYVFKLGSSTFDLKEKSLREKVMLHLRAAKGDKTLASLLEQSECLQKKASGWFSSVEGGKARINRAELEGLAEGCGTSVGVLVTGFGLDSTKMHPSTRSKKTPSVTLPLPVISEADIQNFFKSRVLNEKVQLAEGVPVGRLMALAINPDGVDWVDAFFSLTERGASVQEFVEKTTTHLNKVADEVKIVVLERIARGLWPESE